MLLGVCALLWLSGALWLLLDWVFPQRNEFGLLPNPWEAPLLRVHGLVAVAAVFLVRLGRARATSGCAGGSG